MIEVYSGTRPGRPTLTLILSTLALVGALGLAWFQVRQSRALGPEQAVPGTPLIVRPPRGWTPDRNEPGSFVLRARRTLQDGREAWEIDRRIRFHYERLPTFRAPAEWLSADQPGEFRPEPARIGRFDAVQMRRIERRRWGARIYEGESILRVAWLPGGQQISVVYIPMTDLTTADLTLLDRICAAIRVDDPTLTVSAQQAFQAAGVEFPAENGWPFTLPHLAEVPGLYVGGNQGGLPTWALGVFRTWLGTGRTPRDLLSDFAATIWLLSPESVEVREWQRGDGASMAATRHPNLARNRHPVVSAWVVAKSASEAVSLFAFTDQQHAAAVETLAERIADQVVIKPLDALTTIEPAEQAGTELAALLTRKGAKPWWGREQVQVDYVGTTPQGEEILRIDRSAVSRDPDHGYQGTTRRRSKNQRREENTSWTLDGRAVGYTLEAPVYVSDGVVISTRERRTAGADVVQRVITVNDVERWSGTFQPGPAYIAPPAESIAEAWVARQATGMWLIRVATQLGRGAHSRLLRPLPPKDGHPRTLLQDDYWPLGALLAFDEDGELRYQLEAGVRFERVP